MGKKRKHDGSSDSDEDDKKKKKKDSKKGKKKDSKKAKKEKKKKKKESKKTKKKASSSSDDSSGDSDASQKSGKEAEELDVAPAYCIELPPPEEGIQRFDFGASESGPLGLRFSGGFPPMILSVNPGSHAAAKGVPANFEVHAINGLELVPRNREKVMGGLKSRPVTLDVRPQGWKPQAIVKELERKKADLEAERLKVVALEAQRRDKVARDQQEEAERLAIERKEKAERDRLEHEALQKKAREARERLKAKEQEFEKALAVDPHELRKAAAEVMEADYGVDVLKGRRLPLRLMTRRREVAWVWAGEVMELIGGGVPDASSWS